MQIPHQYQTNIMQTSQIPYKHHANIIQASKKYQANIIKISYNPSKKLNPKKIQPQTSNPTPSRHQALHTQPKNAKTKP